MNDDDNVLYCPTCNGIILEIPMTTTAAITAADVKRLRDETGASMMNCKRALIACNGVFDEACDKIRCLGYAVMHRGKCPHCGQPVYLPAEFAAFGHRPKQ